MNASPDARVSARPNAGARYSFNSSSAARQSTSVPAHSATAMIRSSANLSRKNQILVINATVVLERRVKNLNRGDSLRSEEHTSELQSLMRNSSAVSCLKKKLTKKSHKVSQN